MLAEQRGVSRMALLVCLGAVSTGIHCGSDVPATEQTASESPVGTGGASGGVGFGGTDANHVEDASRSAEAGPGTASRDGGSDGNVQAVLSPAMTYEVTGTWPAKKADIATRPGSLEYQKITVHTRFLAESCSIADYNRDGIPDVSSGRRWYEGTSDPATTFKVEHVFRGGHDDLPRLGEAPEIDTGVSDDFSDFPYDMDGDGWPDIINIANVDTNENKNMSPMPAPQTHATAYWYKNPGPDPAADSLWSKTLMHADVRLENHGFVDVDGDGRPEIFGACKSCKPTETKGYYKGDWANPSAGWTYVPVTQRYTFPFGGTGKLHGEGFGDVNGDGKPDLLERGGVWLQQPGPTWNTSICPADGCGWIKTNLYDGDPGENRGPSHMYAYDVDGDGDGDVVAADWAFGWGLSWYEQEAGQRFIKHQIIASNSPEDLAKYGPIVFSEPASMQVVDMDGDGIPDIITGKMHFAQPIAYGDPDPKGVPYVYVFKTVQDRPGVSGQAHFEPHLVDDEVGVGRQIAVGHANPDGILDICVATKLGLYVFMGSP